METYRASLAEYGCAAPGFEGGWLAYGQQSFWPLT